jgi:hypothetical protein
LRQLGRDAVHSVNSEQGAPRHPRQSLFELRQRDANLSFEPLRLRLRRIVVEKMKHRQIRIGIDQPLRFIGLDRHLDGASESARRNRTCLRARKVLCRLRRPVSLVVQRAIEGVTSTLEQQLQALKLRVAGYVSAVQQLLNAQHS